jgi:hypothetical protein
MEAVMKLKFLSFLLFFSINASQNDISLLKEHQYYCELAQKKGNWTHNLAVFSSFCVGSGILLSNIVTDEQANFIFPRIAPIAIYPGFFSILGNIGLSLKSCIHYGPYNESKIIEFNRYAIIKDLCRYGAVPCAIFGIMLKSNNHDILGMSVCGLPVITALLNHYHLKKQHSKIEAKIKAIKSTENGKVRRDHTTLNF